MKEFRHRFFYMIFCFIILAFGITIFIMAGILPLFIFLLLGIVCITPFFAWRIALKKKLSEIESKGMLESFFDEYENGKKYCFDKLILCSDYIVSKHACRIFSYSEAARIYQVVIKSFGHEVSRNLVLFNKRGTEYVLGGFFMNNKTRNDLDEICRKIASKNPNTEFGYKKTNFVNLNFFSEKVVFIRLSAFK